ncbi:MAG: hypothetical protein VW879_03885, partial [Opitutae bacterium]
MSISQDITLNNSALEKTSSHLSVSRKSLASEEDLFQKFILDKESASMEGEKAIFDQKALDNEEVESNGFLSAREQTQAQQNTANKKTASTTRKSFGLVRPSFEGAKLNSQPIAQSDKSAISPKLYRQKTEAVSEKKTAISRTVTHQTSAKGFTGKPSGMNLSLNAEPSKQLTTKLDAAKTVSAKSKITARAPLLQDKSLTPQTQNLRSESISKQDASLPVLKGQEQEGSTSGNPNGQGNTDQDPNSRHQNLFQSEATIAYQQADVSQSHNTSQQFAQGQTGNFSQAGTFSGAISQLAHQIFRLQQTGQSGTTRLTLDLPDGEKLLVRFHVRRGQGMQVQFSTGSKGLKDSIRESWDNLKVEASQRGITLEEPE